MSYRPRMVEGRFRDALADTPVVVVQGPRQCGKTTMVRASCDLRYVTLDDDLSFEFAVGSPESWLAMEGSGMVIDEAQRAPELSRAVKAQVDAGRRAGMFVLTGSANILAVPKLADSLAGRMELLTLWPFAQSELAGVGRGLVARVFGGDWGGLSVCLGGEDWRGRLLAGGYPEPLGREKEERRQAWFQSYVKALLDRDVRELSQIEGLAQMPRLLRALARVPYGVLNVLDWSRDTGIAATTLTRYLALLEGVFLVRQVPAWTASGQGKAAKTARLAFVDSGVWGHVAGFSGGIGGSGGVGEMGLGALEGWLAMELVKESGWSEVDYEVKHFRSVRRYSVPVVAEARDGRTAGFVVVDRPVATPADFEGLSFFADVAGDDFVAGVVLTAGGEGRRVSERLWSLPLGVLWGGGAG